MHKGVMVNVQPEVVLEHGEFVGWTDGHDAVYFLDGGLLVTEVGASKTFVFMYVGNPLDLYRGGKQLRYI